MNFVFPVQENWSFWLQRNIFKSPSKLNDGAIGMWHCRHFVKCLHIWQQYLYISVKFFLPRWIMGVQHHQVFQQHISLLDHQHDSRLAQSIRSFVCFSLKRQKTAKESENFNLRLCKSIFYLENSERKNVYVLCCGDVCNFICTLLLGFILLYI